MGASYLSAPVFGRPDAAKSANLVQLLGGDAKAKEIVKPIFVPAVAKRVVDAGDEVAKGELTVIMILADVLGSALKLLGNSMILGVVEMLAETYALADVIGFDPEVYQSFIRESRHCDQTLTKSGDFFPLYPYIAYGDNISRGKFNGVGGFRLEAGLKGELCGCLTESAANHVDRRTQRAFLGSRLRPPCQYADN